MRTQLYNFKESVDFDLPSRKWLWKHLGEYDTLAEFVVLAVEDLNSNWDGKCSYKDYITYRANLRKVNLRDGVTLENSKSELIKLFIVNSHARLEDFINLYKDDIKNLICSTFSFDTSDKQTKMDRLLIPLKGLGIYPEFPCWLLPTLNYYRLVRNSVAHSAHDMKACDEAFNKINIQKLNLEYSFFANKAPNRHSDLTIEDFYFYSSCIKHFANYLTMSLKGKIKWGELGKNHESFKPQKMRKGTDLIALVNTVLGSYNYGASQDEKDMILADIKKQNNN